jgi:hypothetical protein
MAKKKGAPGKGFSFGGGGGLGLPGGAKGGLAGQLQAMQQQMLDAQQELGDQTVQVSAGGGAIVVVMSGHQKLQSITIDPEVVNPEDVEMLQDLILSVVNEAVEASQKLAEEKMGGITGGLNLPGLF